MDFVIPAAYAARHGLHYLYKHWQARRAKDAAALGGGEAMSAKAYNDRRWGNWSAAIPAAGLRGIWAQRNWGRRSNGIWKGKIIGGRIRRTVGRKRRTFGRARTTKRYRRTTRTLGGRRGGRRAFRGIRKLRRFGRGRGRRIHGVKGVRLNKAVQRGVRKIVGDCYNNIVDCRILSWSPALANATLAPNLFGIASNWFLDKSDLLDFMNAFLTTAQRDANHHIYPQNCSQKFDLHNPQNTPVSFELFKMTIKCNKGQASGPYVHPTTSTQAGPDLQTDVELAATLWDQSMRDVVNGALVPCSTYNRILAVNGLGVAATIPIAGNPVAASNQWEEVKTAYPFGDHNKQAMKERLGWIFPKLKSSVKVQRVFKGVIPGKGMRSFRVKEKWPNEIRPLDLMDRYVPTLKKDTSFFYFVRMHCPTMIMGGIAPTAGWAAAANTNTQFKTLPCQLIIRHYRYWGCRTSGDHIPNYLSGTTLPSRLLSIGAGTVTINGGGGAGMVVPERSVDQWNQPLWGAGMAP